MYKIGDFSSIVDVSIKTLRYYDDIGLFKPSYQDYFTGYRYYESHQIKDIKVIKKLKEMDLSLNDIKNFLQTKDINILLDKKKEYMMKVEIMNEYLNKEFYKIEEGNYEDYIKWNGLKTKNNPIALEIRDGVANYFMVFKDEEYFSEVIIFPEENNLINLNITFGIKEFLEVLIEHLKNKNYDYITFKSDENVYKNLDIIREKCKCVNEYKETIEVSDDKKFELTNIKVDLK